MSIVPIGLIAVIAYLLGSIPSGVISARAFAGTDVLMTGSGHTGAINTFRAAGIAPAVLTFLADGAKGVIAVGLARQFAPTGAAIAAGAVLVVVGHCYPAFTRFRGGMGLTTAGGVFMLLYPLVLAPLVAVWFPLRWVLRESEYASMAVAALLPLSLYVTGANTDIVTAGVGVGAVLFWRHLAARVSFRRSETQIRKGSF